MTGVYPCGITQRSFAALNTLVLPRGPPSQPQPLAPTGLLPVPHRRSVFPECAAEGLLQHTAFADWLLPLCDVHLRLLQALLCLDSLFLFNAE